MLFILSALLLVVPCLAGHTAFVHLFEWKWSDISKECTEFLGPKGYSGIQISPPTEHVVLDHHPWYQRYQPVSYKLDSRSGSEEEFINMVRTCKSAGVDIYVDAVINHMSSQDEQTPILVGSAGSLYGHYEYPGLYSNIDFHHCGQNSENEIVNWFDRWEVQNCELFNLADLKTGSSYVQGKIRELFRRLTDIGVKGYRIDAAKHIPATDMGILLSDLPKDTFVFHEVIGNSNEPIKPQEYFHLGDLTEFKFGQDIANIFNHGKLDWLNNNRPLGEDWGYFPSNKAVVFLDNHDTQRGTGVLTYKDRKNYELANILMLAWPYGHPQVMSSYAFNTKDEGPPSDHNGRTRNVHGRNGIGCLSESDVMSGKKGWVCEHRWPSIANMVEFRKVTSKEIGISNWWSNHNNQIAFSRGDKGFIAINNEDHPLTRRLQTGLPQGTYIDLIKGKEVRVDQSGWVSIDVESKSALAIIVR